jgi:hypothetical protein
MRAWLLVVVFAACGPKVQTGPAFDEELGPRERAVPANQAAEPPPRPEAPHVRGLRGGTIDRAKLVEVLDHGPGEYLRHFEITARMDGDRFVGWQLVQLLDRTGPLVELDVAPGDVLLAINGKPLSRPDQLQAIWDSLRTANELVASLWRGQNKLELHFAIEPAVQR